MMTCALSSFFDHNRGWNIRVLIGHISSSSFCFTVFVAEKLSGISAAKTLHEAGIHDILILEATDRIGGRIQKTEFSGYTIETGANWIEGGGNPKLINPIWEIANKIKLKTYYSDYSNLSSNIHKKKGGLHSEHTVTLAMDAAETNFGLISNFSESLSYKEHDDISVLASQRLFNHCPTSAVEMVIDYYYYDYEDSEPPRVTSLKNSEPRLTFEEFGDAQYFVADSRGYGNIVQYVAKEFLSSDEHGNITDNRLKLHKARHNISDLSQFWVEVQMEDGPVYHAKYVIVLASIGVLQTNLIEFKLHLPKWKKLAIYEFNMAIFTKIFLKFPYKFWPTGPGSSYFLYAHERRGYYPIWQHFEKVYPGSNILMVVVTDEEARRIEQQTDAETEAEVMEVLRFMFGRNIPNPSDIFVPRWWSNRFFKGSFSNWPIGFSGSNFDRLRAPVGRGRVHYGYVHGAYFSASPFFAPFLESSNILSTPTANARGLFQMPPFRLNNRYFLVRAGESEFESLGVINTNPVAKTSMDSGLSEEGKKQTARAALRLKAMGACDQSCWIWPSITQRAYQAAEIIASVNGVNRSHIVPEYSFLDARGLGAFEGKKLDSIAQVYEADYISSNIKPPPIDDGTPNESVADVFVRVTQLMSILETQYSGDTVIIVSPDSDNLTVLQAGLVGLDLRKHSDLSFSPGEVRFVDAKEIPTYKKPASGVYQCLKPPSCN
ncbi:Amine oxidase [Macleaya cordata]|uniref:Amine oxidase n=1 Tax=Macleaya cordata TaxID=56857 RepID=A0A200QHF5_MACCD|nr:Amine oxidase [Macleaya cordata]